MQYQLIPYQGWENFPDHSELINQLYSVFMPLVNQGQWKYLNLTSGISIFEDENGNTVLLGFPNLNQSIGERLAEIIVTERSKIKGVAKKNLNFIQKKYGLERIELDS